MTLFMTKEEIKNNPPTIKQIPVDFWYKDVDTTLFPEHVVIEVMQELRVLEIPYDDETKTSEISFTDVVSFSAIKNLMKFFSLALKSERTNYFKRGEPHMPVAWFTSISVFVAEETPLYKHLYNRYQKIRYCLEGANLSKIEYCFDYSIGFVPDICSFFGCFIESYEVNHGLEHQTDKPIAKFGILHDYYLDPAMLIAK